MKKFFTLVIVSRRQNSQNLTANFSRNALCSLYAEGVLWARNVRQKAP